MRISLRKLKIKVSYLVKEFLFKKHTYLKSGGLNLEIPEKKETKSQRKMDKWQSLHHQHTRDQQPSRVLRNKKLHYDLGNSV